MTFEIEEVDSDRLALRGRFGASRETYARETFDRIEGSCVLDLEELDHISSAGLGLLVALQLRLDRQGHRVTLANVNPHIQELLRLAALDSIFSIR